MQKPTQNDQPSTLDKRTVLAGLFTVTLFASAFAGIRVGLESYSPQSVALLRYITASFFLVVFAIIKKIPLPAWRDLPGLTFCGLMGFTIYHVALNAGEIVVPAGTASLVIASAPIFVAILASIFKNENITFRVWLGILISFVGVAFISIDPGEKLGISPSVLLILVSAISAAIYTVTQKSFLKTYPPFHFVSYAIWTGTILMLVFIPGLLRDIQTASLNATLAVIYIGIFPGALGYVSWAYVVSKMPASKAGSFLYLTPAMTILIAWIWIGEIPTIKSIFGGVLVLLGVILVQLVTNKRRGQSTSST